MATNNAVISVTNFILVNLQHCYNYCYECVCYFTCSMFNCNSVRWSLNLIKGNLLTYCGSLTFVPVYDGRYWDW